MKGHETGVEEIRFRLCRIYILGDFPAPVLWRQVYAAEPGVPVDEPSNMKTMDP